MDWREALDLVVARTGHGRYRELCADDHPDREIWRSRMVARATGEAPPTVSYPPLHRQALNLAGAIGRAAAASIQGGPVLAPADVVEARRAICLGCEWNGERSSGGIRCKQCGCGGVKLTLATESCPAGRWRRIDPA